MRPSLIIPRLRAQCATLSNRVGGAAEYERALDSGEDFAVPHAFVIPGADAAGENLTTAVVTQSVDDGFSVVVCVSNTSDERGQAGAETLHDLRDEIFAALVGWSPSSTEYDRIVYRGSGEEISINRARLWKRYDFSARMTLQGGP